MKLTYKTSTIKDIPSIYQLCKKLIDDYENIEQIDYDKVLNWIKEKIENKIDEYTTIYVDGKKAGYYHFYKNEDNEYEIDDLYVFQEFQNKGIGTEIVNKCCSLVNEPIILYVFIKNKKAVSLYKKLGFEIIKTINNSRYIMKRMNKERNYYEAYEERYKTVHAQGIRWSNDVCTPIVLETIKKYKINHNHKMLEIGCGEGRDSKTVLDNGYNLMATDISNEAISYCKKTMPQYENSFCVLDCLTSNLNKRFDFIFGIAVIHMLVLDDHRDGFYHFIYNHLNEDGFALICTMGDGEFEIQSDVNKAFEIQEREHEIGKLMVANTSCRMISFKTFKEEIERNKLEIIEQGITSSLPNFNSLMYAVVKRK